MLFCSEKVCPCLHLPSALHDSFNLGNGFHNLQYFSPYLLFPYPIFEQVTKNQQVFFSSQGVRYGFRPHLVPCTTLPAILSFRVVQGMPMLHGSVPSCHTSQHLVLPASTHQTRNVAFSGGWKLGEQLLASVPMLSKFASLFSLCHGTICYNLVHVRKTSQTLIFSYSLSGRQYVWDWSTIY